MGKAKTWSSAECEGAAKAFVDSALDEICGAEQRGEEFAAKVHEAFKSYTPPGVSGTGTWTDHAPGGTSGKIWNYICDTILKDVQHFYRALNLVLNMGLSGLTHEEKVNIAAAIFLKRVKEGATHHEYKGFDANKWRLFKAYLMLKETGKLAELTTATHPSEEMEAVTGSGDTPAESDANEGFITGSSQLKLTT